MINKKHLIFFFTSFLLLTSCSKETNLIKIFVSSYEEVNVDAFKQGIQDDNYSLEISYSIPSSYYYSFQYNVAREKEYDIFILRDDEFTKSKIEDIYIPFNDESLSLFTNRNYSFFAIESVNYAIKLTNNDYVVNHLLTFEENHDYYIGIAKLSRNCGKFSSFSNISSHLSFKALDNLLTIYE